MQEGAYIVVIGVEGGIYAVRVLKCNILKLLVFILQGLPFFAYSVADDLVMQFSNLFISPEDRQVWTIHYLEEWIPEGFLPFAHLMNTEEHKDFVLVIKVIFMLLYYVTNLALSNPCLTYDQFGGNKEICFIDTDVSFGSNSNECTILSKGNWIFNSITDDAIVLCPLVK